MSALRRLPFLGHLLSYKRDPLGFLTELAKQQGDVAWFSIGPQRMCFFTRPEDVKSILVRQQASFTKSRAMQQAKRVLGNGLLTAEGELHRQQRRLMEPAFARRHVERCADVMVRRASQVAASWVDGEVVDVEQDMMQLALGTVSETMFGADLAPETSEISAALTEGMTYLMTMMLPFASWLSKLPLPINRRFKEIEEQLDATIFDIIARHREPGRTEGTLLDLLIAARDDDRGMSDAQLRDEVMTIFLTGYETVGTTLTWTLHLLSRHPEVSARLTAELSSVLGARSPRVEDVSKLVYTRRVLTESMRLYPPAWGISRRAHEDVKIGDAQLAAGDVALVSQWVTHRDARLFWDPERFDPDRWTDDVDRTLRASYAFFPFGGGPRSCIGERFAWMEATLALAVLASRWQTEPTTTDPIPLMPLISLRPARGLALIPRSQT